MPNLEMLLTFRENGIQMATSEPNRTRSDASAGPAWLERG